MSLIEDTLDPQWQKEEEARAMKKNEIINVMTFRAKEFGLKGDPGDRHDRAEQIYREMMSDSQHWAWDRYEYYLPLQP